MRKPAFCICENKDADQLRGNREADQGLCFRYTDSTIPLLPVKFQASRHLQWLYSPVYVGPGQKTRRPERGSIKIVLFVLFLSSVIMHTSINLCICDKFDKGIRETFVSGRFFINVSSLKVHNMKESL